MREDFFTDRPTIQPSTVLLVAGDFAPKRVCTHRVRTHIDSPSYQVLKKIYLPLTEQKRQHCSHNETTPHKTCLFLVRKRKFMNSKKIVYDEFRGTCTNSVNAKRTFYLMGQACCDQRFFSTFDTQHKKTSDEIKDLNISG